MKLPAMFFYTGDWLKDPQLRRCTHEEKGVYIDMLCLMHECEERGVLATAGSAWSDEEVARAIGGDHQRTLSCVVALVVKGVISRNSSGAIYSRRMVRDEQKRQKCSEAGKKGGGNPTFKGVHKGHFKGSSKGIAKGAYEGEIEDEVKRVVSKEPEYPENLNNPEFISAWESWISVHGKYKPKGREFQLKRLSEWGSAKAIAAIKLSIAQEWDGIHPDKNFKETNDRQLFDNCTDSLRPPAKTLNDFTPEQLEDMGEFKFAENKRKTGNIYGR